MFFPDLTVLALIIVQRDFTLKEFSSKKLYSTALEYYVKNINPDIIIFSTTFDRNYTLFPKEKGIYSY